MPVSLSVDARALERAAAALSLTAHARLPLAVRGAVYTLAETARTELARATPRAPDDNRPEGAPHAADLWEVRPDGPQSASVVNTATSPAGAPYVEFLFSGTAPHLIEPVQANMLHFRVGGEDIFARAVQHPGTQRNEALVGVLEAQKRHADEALAELGARVTAEMGGAVRRAGGGV